MKKVILITGISTGFGRETARILSNKGYTVFGTVRCETERIPGVNYLLMDLTNSESIKVAVSEVLTKVKRIDVLINNAGMHTGGPAETSPEENIRIQFETNFMGTVFLIKQVIPGMRENGGGLIINISSIGGLMGLPFQPYYSAAKFALEGFSEALRMEVNSFGIRVVLVNPGDFNTNNTNNRRNYMAPTGDSDPYNEQFKRTLAVIEKDESAGWKPEILAVKVADIIESRNPRQRYIVASFEQKLAVILKYLLPGKVFRRILMDHYKIK
jgi:NAD(P)-dependent dehydrogenase (short-subunit alcohol dehydrogenase family)